MKSKSTASRPSGSIFDISEGGFHVHGLSAEFDRFADEYEAQHAKNIKITGESPEYFSEYKIRELSSIANRLGETPSSIFDFGSGIGNSIPFFREYFAGAKLTCGDVSSRSIKLSKSRYPGDETYTLIESDRIPIENDAFDLTFSACVFHHIPHRDHTRWFRELFRITRSGGMIVVFEHNPLNPLTVQAVRTCPFDANAKLIRAGHLAKSIQSQGWRSARIQYHIFFPRLLAVLRPTEKNLRWLPMGAQYSVNALKS